MVLTIEQEKVVGISAGRHLVLAPPGSGKTEMLSQRILRALEAGVPPERMLCATFTNRAAFEMRERMATAADGRALPDVGNIHHFCHRFLLSVGRIHPGIHVLDEVEQVDFVREVVEVLRLELKSGKTADLKRTHGVSVMGLINGMGEPMRARLHELLETTLAEYFEKGKNPYADFLSAALIVHQQRIGIPPCYLRQLPPGLLELVGDGVVSAVERAYSGLKRRFRSVDFDDLLNEAYLFLSKHSLPDEKRFDWVQIDEIQDLNLRRYGNVVPGAVRAFRRRSDAVRKDSLTHDESRPCASRSVCVFPVRPGGRCFIRGGHVCAFGNRRFHLQSIGRAPAAGRDLARCAGRHALDGRYHRSQARLRASGCGQRRRARGLNPRDSLVCPFGLSRAYAAANSLRPRPLNHALT